MSKARNREILVLEMKDEVIFNLFNLIRSTFKSGTVPSSPHITIRGPYLRGISSKRSQIINSDLKEIKSITVNGIDRFDFNDISIVFLKVDCENLRKIWWKPEYPIKSYGFNPHITIFKGSKDDANIVCDFLKEKDIHFSLKNFNLRTESIGQRELNFSYD